MNKITRKIVVIAIALVIIVSVAVIIGASTPAPVLAPIPIPATTPTPTLPTSPVTQCRATGCSSQVCADQDVITTCEFRPEFACYRTAKCERQVDGQCDWTITPELQACLALQKLQVTQ